jgi:hypothetical protein
MNRFEDEREGTEGETWESAPPSPTRRCPICGRKLPADNPAAWCPVCLLRIALDPAGGGDWPMDEENFPESAIAAAEADPGRFGHYEVLTRPDGSLHELGHGAMGITFKAIDLNLNIPVALKVLNLLLLQEELAPGVFSGRHDLPRVFAIQTLPPFIILVPVSAKSFMRWSL